MTFLFIASLIALAAIGIVIYDIIVSRKEKEETEEVEETENSEENGKENIQEN